MKQIYNTQVLQVQPCQTGFIFVEKQEAEEEKTVINYKMLDFERASFNPVTRNVYLLAKFGNRFERFEENAEEFLSMKTLFFPERYAMVCDSDGLASLYTGDGLLRYQRSLVYNEEVPYDLVLGDTCFWASYPENGAVIRYSLHNLRQELRIGGGASRLPSPKGLYYQHEKLLFCSPTEKKVFQLDPVTFEMEAYHSFEEPIHNYYKYHSHEIVWLDSGIYKL
ncbi:MAG: hypothetical protein IKM39_03680 [Clostridia bacterium]|nr:hypothetical protein [Clostridia bacterium]